ncbi:MAG TPA: D-xylose ABC transporter ATP-binding protein [Planctomycetaceae bacterium]|nr:D-xylose ABC transporter ATP-binding protein [Blastopirellula sp.]HAY82772.1 D-xylose ABC transporter ATP-binding protein [Planctomycetaceae bacterium]
MQGIQKSFPGVRALAGVDLELHAGEVLALLGENGAGKSTLIKILGGAQRPDAGTILIDGAPVSLPNPTAAQRAGIGIIYQEFNLVPAMTAQENLFLGHERATLGVVHTGPERRQTEELFERIGVPINPSTLCRDLTVAQQQVVEIAKCLLLDARIIVMDEPSATLTPREVERLYVIINELKAQGIGVIYISHRLDEIFDMADRVTVLRDGQHVGTKDITELTRDKMIEMMVARSLDQEFPKKNSPIGQPRLVAKNLTRGSKVQDVSLAVHAGEVLGLTGLVGAGRTETARLLFGADRAERGTITLDGRTLQIKTPRDAMRAGICLLTEDRKSEGLVLGQSVLENFALPNMKRLAPFGLIQGRRENDAFANYVQSLQIKISGHSQLAATLSGGNQQKVVLAKWLERNAEVIIFDEPTRGIDVGAKYEIYLLMNELASKGKAVLMISSELPEVLGMSDRILVMHEGRIRGEITEVQQATQEDILNLAIGGQETAAR